MRSLLTQWEQITNELGSQLTGNEHFGESMNRFHSMQMQVRQQMQETMGKTLQTYNLPSREDVIQLGERIAAIEDTLARIERRLDDTAPEKKSDRPARTRKPPKD